MAETKRRSLTQRDKIIIGTKKRESRLRGRGETTEVRKSRKLLSDLKAAYERGEIKNLKIIDPQDAADYLKTHAHNIEADMLSVEPQDEQQLRARIERSFENIELIRRRMANDQLEIDRLRNETRAMIAQILT